MRLEILWNSQRMLIHNADVVKIRVSLPKGLWTEHSDKYTSFVLVLYPAWPLMWISDVAAEGKPPLECRAYLRHKDGNVCRAAWPSLSSSCGIPLVHGRLQITSPKAAPHLLGATPHHLPAPSSISQTRSDRASLGHRQPFGGWWAVAMHPPHLSRCSHIRKRFGFHSILFISFHL